jgi:octaprenyl-diphosphate synthase
MTQATVAFEAFSSSISEDLARVERRLNDKLYSELAFVNALCERIRRYRGKMLRPRLVLLVGQASGRLSDDHTTLATVVELIHAATLLHDDVLDQADIRRRQPTINSTDGNQTAVLLGDYLTSHAFHLCSGLEDQYASRAIGATANLLCEGELMQVHQRGNVGLAESDYLEIIRRKTAALIGTCCAVGAKYAGANTEAVQAWQRYGVDLGMAFQIVDDVLDCVGTERQMGKTLGRDMELGEATLPVIHALSQANGTVRKGLISVLGNGKAVPRERVQHWLEQTGSIEYSYGVADGYLSSARQHLQSVPPSAARDSLTAVIDFVRVRDQ